ncbi:probable uridine nucleosidase 2 [Trichogramma pretiosum]|uniref:probable uridine nucleosidase 2 n=1 Tax=Trichogramma pretiosum TaxID=7493 RepID=UPI000C71C253|nr:probable uridine nucleosidase 2 [Trichogramma pretiosum]
MDFKIILAFLGLLIPDIHAVHDRLKLLIDTDAGSDDAVALMLALKASDMVDVVAITCTYGNTVEENVEKNVLKILTIAGRTDVPVYSGSKKPLKSRSYKPTNFFGIDGMGDMEFAKEVTAEVDRSMTAPEAMSYYAKLYPKKLNIVLLGPLTNVARAVQLDPQLAENVQKFWSMGACPLGNGAPAPDFNYGLDPESVHLFFKNTKQTPITIFPGCTRRKHKIHMDWRAHILGSQRNSEIIEFLNKAEQIAIKSVNGEWISDDSLALSSAIWPKKIITKRNKGEIIPITGGLHRGFVIFKKQTSNKNVEIVEDYNHQMFQLKLLKYLK